MQDYAVVIFTCPGQSDKTTLAKLTFPRFIYCNPGIPEVSQIAKNDPKVNSGFVIYAGELAFISRDVEVLNFVDTYKIFN